MKNIKLKINRLGMTLFALSFMLGPQALAMTGPSSSSNIREGDPEAIVSLGERLFKDIRFSQYFKEMSAGNVNHSLSLGDSRLETIVIRGQEEESPFRGEAFSCASCHMVDQSFNEDTGNRMRGYNDFAVRSKVPVRKDGGTNTLRNTPALVGIGSKYAVNRFSHHDGEFQDHSETVLGNMTGRNMGWLGSEKKMALQNIVNVIREDNGESELAQEFGGSYSKILLGADLSISEDQLLPLINRIDLRTMSDEQIIEKVIFFVNEYMNSINFETNEEGQFVGSTYDDFLAANGLPAGPKDGQSNIDYTRDLIRGFQKLKEPTFIASKKLSTYKRTFKFQQLEWDGLKIFFNLQAGSNIGMCVNCHMPPMFTDQFFHNVGSTQLEYEKVHGAGSFQNIKLPSLASRNSDEHGRPVFFSKRASTDNTQATDLGMWNFFGREGKGVLTEYVTKNLCRSNDSRCTPEFLLPFMVGRIKTPTLRNLGQSEPYLHNGSAKTLHEVLETYITAGDLMKVGQLKNGAPQLRRMDIQKSDLKALEAFMHALNSEYE